jgi:hypothetical protein
MSLEGGVTLPVLNLVVFGLTLKLYTEYFKDQFARAR